ncbi:hypothetical protein FMO13_15110 [Xanthomonas phaseoli pv. dieffenbachiae]
MKGAFVLWCRRSWGCGSVIARFGDSVPPYPYPNPRSTPRPAPAARALQGTHASDLQAVRLEGGLHRFRLALQFKPSGEDESTAEQLTAGASLQDPSSSGEGFG